MAKSISKNKKNNRGAEHQIQFEQLKKLIQQGLREEAWQKIRARLLLVPDDVVFLQEAAKLARDEKKFAESIRYYQRALRLAPDKAQLLNGLGITYFNANRFEEAETYYLAARQKDPNYDACYNNYAVLLTRSGRYDEALQQFQQAVKLRPDLADIRFRMSIVLMHIGRLDDAEREMRRVLKAQPAHTRCDQALGSVLIQQGYHREGWNRYQSRYSVHNKERFFSLPNLTQPYWQGESLVGKTIMVFTEQGRGDEIQFCRYLSRLKREKQARRVIFVGRASLRSLISTLDGLDDYVPEAGERPFDYWCMLLDLPLWFLDSPHPFVTESRYLYSDAASQARWPIVSDRLRVGVVWKGAADHDNDKQRSLSHFSVLAPLLAIADIDWVSLQKGAGEDELAPWPQVRPLGAQFQDYSDTAAVVEQLHLIIGVDTSVIHLAGAMGKPCWVILPATMLDWRWQLQREDTYWYPSMRMFPRQRGEDEQAVVARIEQALRALFIAER